MNIKLKVVACLLQPLIITLSFKPNLIIAKSYAGNCKSPVVIDKLCFLDKTFIAMMFLARFREYKKYQFLPYFPFMSSHLGKSISTP